MTSQLSFRKLKICCW